ncbi:MAG: insulinase family protein [Bacteroidota bacterium]
MKTRITHVLIAAFWLILFSTSVSAQSKIYKYDTVPNDPYKARIYTLDNGLKVYLSVYKEKPRIYTNIAVRTGSKNDPANNTGLSHYLEHMMFKGTQHFGTVDYKTESVYLNKIDSLFEVYRTQTDTNLRRFTYHIIDSISGVAAKYAVANEYDKMLAYIGAQGTNAYTSVEQTVYVNNIPENQLKTWLDIEFDRFSYPVFRLFHTELETVYEEKNMSLDNDMDKVWEALYAGLFQKHSYGTQTTIGTVEHLKNPSLIALKNYYQSRYVPGNMALCMAGDFNPDSAIVMIDKTFGKLKSKEIPTFNPPVESPIEKPIVKEVMGPEAEMMMFGYRFPGAGSDDVKMLTLISMILNNSTAGLIDLNLKQDQKVLDAGCFLDAMNDYSALILYGYPKEGQTLDQVKDLLIEQLNKIKKGEFADWLLTAIINDFKKSEMQSEESIYARVGEMTDAFVKHLPWKDKVDFIAKLEKINKTDIINFANKNFADNYVIVYKRTGEDKNVKKVSKPHITPIDVNRNSQSAFLQDINTRVAKDIAPAPVDFNKEMSIGKLDNGIEVLYKKNTENKRFELYYYFDMGNDNNNKMNLTVDYLKYLGTTTQTARQLKELLYQYGCDFNVNCSNDQMWVSLVGLDENMKKGLDLFENLLADAKPDEAVLKNLAGDILQQRKNDKLSKDVILWSAMYDYGMFGSDSPFKNILSDKQLKNVNPKELVGILKSLNTFTHKILYYGPMPQQELTEMLGTYHKVPAKMNPVPEAKKFIEQNQDISNVYVVDYDMKQAEIIMLSKVGPYDKNILPIRKVFNEYFGGGMSSIVFQDLREARGLAYSAYASFTAPGRPDRSHYLYLYIGTQNDKMPEAMKAMSELANNMPESDKSFAAAKEAAIKQLQTSRTTKSSVLFYYLNLHKMGFDHDMTLETLKAITGFQFSDLKAFQQKFVKDRKYTILVLGKKNQLDSKTLEKYGKINYLTLEDIFGY